MKKLRIVCVGKNKIPFVKSGISLYIKKISKYINVTFEEIKPYKYGASEVEKFRNQETKNILKILKNNEINVFLDAKGKKETSLSLANFLEKRIIEGKNRINFFIGGAYGFEKRILPKGVHYLSLSDMTFNHQLVRIILLEQIYRAFTIIRGEPYHNG